MIAGTVIGVVVVLILQLLVTNFKVPVHLGTSVTTRGLRSRCSSNGVTT